MHFSKVCVCVKCLKVCTQCTANPDLVCKSVTNLLCSSLLLTDYYRIHQLKSDVHYVSTRNIMTHESVHSLLQYCYRANLSRHAPTALQETCSHQLHSLARHSPLPASAFFAGSCTCLPPPPLNIAPALLFLLVRLWTPRHATGPPAAQSLRSAAAHPDHVWLPTPQATATGRTPSSTAVATASEYPHSAPVATYVAAQPQPRHTTSMS